MESRQAQRKNEHLSLARKYYDQAHASHPFDQVRLIHTALPETAVADVDITSPLTKQIRLNAPFYFEAMTGGSQAALTINRQLAQIAAKYQLAMATGSVSIALKDPAARESFTVIRDENPDGIVIANLSSGASLTDARAAIDLLGANALELHLNAAQELIMPEGDRRFFWLDNIRELATALDVPVIVKEVGFGMNKVDVAKLAQAGVEAINVSGRGGTNFALIENRRNHKQDFATLAQWGQTTPEALLEARAAKSGLPVIASGGISSPVDLIKAAALGASSCGVAGYFLNILQAAGPAVLDQEVADWLTVIPRLLALQGVEQFSDLSVMADTLLAPELARYAQQRQLL